MRVVRCLARRQGTDERAGQRRAAPEPGPGHLLSTLVTPPTDGQVCTLFAADIAGFTDPVRDDDIRWYLHKELYAVLEEAFDGAGISWDRCFREDRGDGLLAVLPPGIACKNIIDPLPGRLAGLIRRHNHVFVDAAALQLRTAVHIGPVEHDGNGFIGSDINLLFRMLNARPLKQLLSISSAELALIVSDYVHDNVVCRYPSLISPGAFQPVKFQHRRIITRAWTYAVSTRSA
jgi:hypothetical protein